jgi:hypothetical protein
MWQNNEENRKSSLAARGALIFFLFFALYLLLSSAFLLKTSVFSNYVLFNTDIPRVIGDMTIFGGDHYRTKVHPLYVLLVNPLGSSLVRVIGSELGTATLLNSFLGAAGVLLSFIFFSQYMEKVFDAWLLAFVFGMSASQLIFGILPETASLAVCSLIVTYTLFVVSLKKSRANFLPWVLAGVFTLGVTTTNFVQTLICFGICSFLASDGRRPPESPVRAGRGNFKPGTWLRWGLRVAGFVTAVVLVTAGLALLQRAIYPSASLFFLPESYSEDLHYVDLTAFRKPLEVLGQLLKHFLVINFIAPSPHLVSGPPGSLPAVDFRVSTFHPYGIVALALWIAWWARRGLNFRPAGKAPGFSSALILGFLLCLGFNLALHSIYGLDDMFLYTGNFTFPVLGILAAPKDMAGRGTRLLIAVFAGGLAINNLFVIAEILRVFVVSQ